MRLNLIKGDSTVTSGVSELANSAMIGSVFRYEGTDYVVVSCPPVPVQINALEISPMTLDESNFTVGG